MKTCISNFKSILFAWFEGEHAKGGCKTQSSASSSPLHSPNSLFFHCWTSKVTSASRATTTAETHGISSASCNITRMMVNTWRSFNWSKKQHSKFWKFLIRKWNSTKSAESNLNRDWCNKCSFNSQNNIGITTPTEINVHNYLTFFKILNTNTCMDKENMNTLILKIKNNNSTEKIEREKQ